MAMNPLERMPVSGQTLFADLADMAWTGIFREVMASAGTLCNRAIARANTATSGIGSPCRGRNPALGKVSRSGFPDARPRIRDRTELAADRKDRLEIVRALRASRLPVPDGLSGKVLADLSEAGAFRLRRPSWVRSPFGATSRCLVSGCPENRFAPAMSISASSPRIPLPSTTGATRTSLRFSRADRRFEAIPSPIDMRRVLRYAIRIGTQEAFSVDVLSRIARVKRSNCLFPGIEFGADMQPRNEIRSKRDMKRQGHYRGFNCEQSHTIMSSAAGFLPASTHEIRQFHRSSIPGDH